MLDTFAAEDVVLLLEPGADPDFDAIDDALAAADLEVLDVETLREQPF